MKCGEMVSRFSTWFLNLFKFTNKSLEEVFVPLADDKEIVVELVNTVIEPTENKKEDVSDTCDDIPELISVDEEYGIEEELENIDNSLDDDYDYYYHE